MIAELGLDRAHHLADFGAENRGVEFLDHLTRSEFPEVSALLSRRTLGMLFCDSRKICTGFNLGFQICTRFTGGHYL